jgi:hypothetical protein
MELEPDRKMFCVNIYPLHGELVGVLVGVVSLCP